MRHCALISTFAALRRLSDTAYAMPVATVKRIRIRSIVNSYQYPPVVLEHSQSVSNVRYIPNG
jgi:hypothetical protein